MEKLPFLATYLGDYYKSDIQFCSLAARGLWHELRLIMATSERYGYLVKDNRPMALDYLASKVRASESELQALLLQLVSAGIPGKTESGIYYDPDMVEQQRIRTLRSKAGELGGNPRLKKKVNQRLTTMVKQNMTCNDMTCKDVVLPEDLTAFKQEIYTWIEYKRERKEKYTPRGLSALWSRLRAIQPHVRKLAIEHSMSNNWSGIYEPKHIPPPPKMSDDERKKQRLERGLSVCCGARIALYRDDGTQRCQTCLSVQKNGQGVAFRAILTDP